MNAYSCLLYIVHLLIRLVLAAYRALYRIKLLLQCRRDRTLEQIVRDGKVLNRLPLHIGLLLVEDDISYQDISKIIVWSMALRIYCISIYDHKGTLKKNHSKLHNELLVQQHELFGNTKYCCINLKGSGENGKNGTGENGFSQPKMTISLLSHSDGKQNVAQAANQLCTEISMKNIKPDDLTVDQINDQLLATYGLPDPDVLIRFGQTKGTFGYLPWQIRLTEILSLPTHKNIHYESFMGLLRSYGMIEQRIGK